MPGPRAPATSGLCRGHCGVPRRPGRARIRMGAAAGARRCRAPRRPRRARGSHAARETRRLLRLRRTRAPPAPSRRLVAVPTPTGTAGGRGSAGPAVERPQRLCGHAEEEYSYPRRQASASGNWETSVRRRVPRGLAFTILVRAEPGRIVSTHAVPRLRPRDRPWRPVLRGMRGADRTSLRHVWRPVEGDCTILPRLRGMPDRTGAAAAPDTGCRRHACGVRGRATPADGRLL
jgi:hypothetical protein